MHSTIYFVAAIAAASANVGSHVRLVITHSHYCPPPTSPTLIIAHHLLLPTNEIPALAYQGLFINDVIIRGGGGGVGQIPSFY